MEVESIAILRSLEIQSKFGDNVDLSKVYVADNLAYPAELEIQTMGAAFELQKAACNPVRYNKEGLLAYDCETKGGMSGGLVTLKSSGAAIGIHLGRKSTVGYAAAFNAIATQAQQHLDGIQSAGGSSHAN